MLTLEPGILDWRACLALGASIRPEDREECLYGDPWRALTGATRLGGESYTALKGPALEDILGAFGWTDLGTIWSLWRKLTHEETVSVLAHTPVWVRGMVTASERLTLYNLVSTSNLPALAWLRLSKCFDFSDKPLVVDDIPYLRFETKPLEELP